MPLINDDEFRRPNDVFRPSPFHAPGGRSFAPFETGADYANPTVDNPEPQGFIADGAIFAEQITSDAVTTDKLSAEAVTAGKIAADAVTAVKIDAGAVTADKIAANAVTAVKIAANAVETDKLDALAVVAAKIAAGAVITDKILAGNVTSAKIELTVSGKNFGANSGSRAAPGVFFDVANDLGLTINGTGTDLVLSSGGGVLDPFLQVGPSAGGVMLGQAGDLFPGIDNSFSCGISGARWLDVWAVDTTINSSDERLKKDITESPLGLEFVMALRPVAYRWKDTVDTQARERAPLDKKALEAEVAPLMDLIEKTRERQVAGEVSEKAANLAIERARQKLTKIKERHLAPVAAARAARRPGRRWHFGLVAQQVKTVLDEAGVDASLFKIGPDGVQSLGYTELIAPMLKAIQEQQAQIESLVARVAALEAKGK